METAFHYRGNVSSKLQREMENLAILQESMSRSETMSHNMLSILNTFESRLSKLEETINPIYRETGNLQRRHENIERTVEELDKVIGYYHVADEVDIVIRDGPSNGLQNYMACMDRLQKAVAYLTNNNPGSPEMSQVTMLYEAGKDAMEREFRSLLTRHGKPVPAPILIDILSIDDEDIDMAELESLDQLPANVREELKSIASWLLSCGYDTDYMQVYASIKASLLVKTLNGLKEHVKQEAKDGASLASVVGSGSPALGLKSRSTPQRKPSKKLLFGKKVPVGLKKNQESLTPAGIVRQMGSFVSIKEEGSEVDTGFYIIAVLALLKLIQSENLLMHDVIPEKHHRKVFDLVVQSALDLIIKDGEQICSFVRKCTARHNISSVIHLFPVLRQLRAVKTSFDVTLEGCQVPTRNKLPALISNLDASGAKALEEFVEYIRNDPDKLSSMPKDGTVHELTSNTMLFLEQLLEFAETAGAMLHTQDPNSLQNVQIANRPRLKLAEFFTKVLSALGLNLNNKFEAYSDPALRSVFMLNNFNYILKSLRRADMLEIIHLWNNEVGTFYDEQILDQKRSYSQRSSAVEIVKLKLPDVEQTYTDQVQHHVQQYKNSWSRVIHYISENQAPVAGGPLSPDSKMKEKERNAVKEKFTGFNKELEEVYRVQKTFTVPDPELRTTLREDNKKFILPYYSAFLRRYRSAPFTKNPDKYIKYSEQDLIRIIDGLFDSAA